MPAISASAPAKAILLGEHAVVYGQPAIAIPLPQMRTRAMILATPNEPAGRVQIASPAIDLEADYADLAETDPIQKSITLVAEHFGIKSLPAMKILINSNIPVSSGLGSGASVSVALLRALSTFLGHPLSDAQVSGYAFEVEKIHHNTPSGIDNTVITYEKALIYERGKALQFLQVLEPFELIIANSGEHSTTHQTVSMVRHDFNQDPALYESYFKNIGDLVNRAVACLEKGSMTGLGHLMNENQVILKKMRLSTPKLDALIDSGMQAGAFGAKLTGGGGGGCILSLVDATSKENVKSALKAASATDIFQVKIASKEEKPGD